MYDLLNHGDTKIQIFIRYNPRYYLSIFLFPEANVVSHD